MTAWAGQDAQSALEWLQKLPPDDTKQTLSLGFSYEVARGDPMTALDLAGTLSPSPERDQLLTFAVRQWATTSYTAAETWAMKVADPGLEQRLVAAVAVASAKQDGARSAMLAATALRSGEEQDRAAVSIVEQWAQLSPGPATAWASEFPKSLTRDAAISSLKTLEPSETRNDR
jgi:hypothetical protein